MPRYANFPNDVFLSLGPCFFLVAVFPYGQLQDIFFPGDREGRPSTRPSHFSVLVDKYLLALAQDPHESNTKLTPNSFSNINISLKGVGGFPFLHSLRTQDKYSKVSKLVVELSDMSRFWTAR